MWVSVLRVMHSQKNKVARLLGLLILLSAPEVVLAQDKPEASTDRESPQSSEAPAQPASNQDNRKDESAPVAEFKPSEEVLADTILTLPADI